MPYLKNRILEDRVGEHSPASNQGSKSHDRPTRSPAHQGMTRKCFYDRVPSAAGRNCGFVGKYEKQVSSNRPKPPKRVPRGPKRILDGCFSSQSNL
jgi:hypothetical protein